eukprot:15730266-Heterocapsa_arctica.AAC.1
MDDGHRWLPPCRRSELGPALPMSGDSSHTTVNEQVMAPDSGILVTLFAPMYLHYNLQELNGKTWGRNMYVNDFRSLDTRSISGLGVGK